MDNIHVTAALYKLQRTLKLSRQLQYVKNPEYIFQPFSRAVPGYHLERALAAFLTNLKALRSATAQQRRWIRRSCPSVP